MSVNATTQRPAALQSQRGVPWLTVVPLAVVMAYGDGFWMTSLRGATGAIERTQGPFAHWLRESTLALPVFMFAVLGALMLALRLFGPAVGSLRKVGATALLVVAGGTLVGLAKVAASSVYDYHLQSAQLQVMDSMRGSNAASSLAQQREATLGLQVHTVAYGAVILLVTNLVLVGWVVAMRGGRLNLAAIREPKARPVSQTDPPERRPGTPAPSTAMTSATSTAHRSRAGDLRLLLAAGLVAGAAVHAAVVPQHLTEWGAAGVFFVLLAAAELAVAALLLTRPQPAVLLAAAVVSVGPLALWLYSRTVGIPFGPGAGVPEPIGQADLAAFALELSTLIVAVVLIRATRWRQRPPASAHLRWLALTAVVAVTVLGLTGSGLAGFGDVGSTTGHTSVTTAPR